VKAAFLLLAAVSAIAAAERVGDIEFYGYKGFNIAKVRAALPVKEGDAFLREDAGIDSPGGGQIDRERAYRGRCRMLRRKRTPVDFHWPAWRIVPALRL